MKQSEIFFQSGDAIRGVSDAVFQYYLKDKTDSVKIEIMDAQGKVIQTFKGDKPEYKADPNIPRWEREPAKPTTAQGLNIFSWNLRYPGATSFEGMILWGANAKSGPKAPIGKYQVLFTAGSYSQTFPFSILMDPNLTGVSETDLKETFDLTMKIRDRESTNNEAVIQIRKIKKQIDDGLKSNSDPAIASAAKDLVTKLTAIEEELYQTKNRSGQDPLNFPIKLGNRISAVRRSLETGDAKPTAGIYKVFGELSKELDVQLNKLNSLLNGDVPNLKQKLNLNK